MYSMGYLSRCIAMRHGHHLNRYTNISSEYANYEYVIGKVENLAKYDAQYYYKAIVDVDV